MDSFYAMWQELERLGLYIVEASWCEIQRMQTYCSDDAMRCQKRCD